MDHRPVASADVSLVQSSGGFATPPRGGFVRIRMDASPRQPSCAASRLLLIGVLQQPHKPSISPLARKIQGRLAFIINSMRIGTASQK